MTRHKEFGHLALGGDRPIHILLRAIFATNKVTSAAVPSDAPPGCVIKGNINTKGDKIYHVPGDDSYDETVITTSKGERYFCSTEEAEAAGWRAAQR